MGVKIVFKEKALAMASNKVDCSSLCFCKCLISCWIWNKDQVQDAL